VSKQVVVETLRRAAVLAAVAVEDRLLRLLRLASASAGRRHLVPETA
jgi:hypothetical protein